MSKKRIKKVLHDKNPFALKVLEQLYTNSYHKKTWLKGDDGGVGAAVIVDGDGQVTGGNNLYSVKKVDGAQFTKVYANEVQNIFSLTKTTAAVFKYILDNLCVNCDTVYLQEAKVTAAAKISDKSYRRAIESLVKNEIIAASVDPYLYYINPTLFFNGDRFALIRVFEKDGVKVPTLSKELPENQNFLLEPGTTYQKTEKE